MQNYCQEKERENEEEMTIVEQKVEDLRSWKRLTVF